MISLDRAPRNKFLFNKTAKKNYIFISTCNNEHHFAGQNFEIKEIRYSYLKLRKIVEFFTVRLSMIDLIFKRALPFAEVSRVLII